MQVVQDFKELKAWQAGIELARVIFRATRGFPPEERYGLTNQMLRSAVSIPSNIAEGYGRGSQQDYLRFLKVARGSAAELETQVILARDFGYLQETEELTAAITQCRRLLQALIKSLS